jgi:hypothetical protein
VPYVEPTVNPVDLGTILVPAGWFLIGPGQTAEVEVAAISRRAGEKNVRLRVWFASEKDKAISASIALPLNERVGQRIRLPPIPTNREHDDVHVAIERSDGDSLWEKIIPAMIVRTPPQWPRFGATSSKLRYDAPISVRRDDGTLSTLEYSKGWDPGLNDVVVSLPTGARFVFWRGSCYVPFWAGRQNTGLSYEWAETAPPPGGFTDSVEPLMDKELRYGRVEIVESTAARVHVRWSYQSCDFKYKIWGDSAAEDFYFYPDGFGTRVLTLQSAPNSRYEISEFIILSPQDAYPLEVLPSGIVDILFLDGEKRTIDFPYDAKQQGGKLKSRDLPTAFRVHLHKNDPMTAIYSHAEDRRLPPVVFGPFKDAGQIVTPCYWGSHWPLARGQTTGRGISDRIHVTPAHNSVMTWAMQRPPVLRESQIQTVDSVGHSKRMQIQTWVWLIGLTDADDSRVLEWAKSFGGPPAIEGLKGARLEVESFAPERRAVRLIAEGFSIAFTLEPVAVCVNPVFEIRNASSRLKRILLDKTPVSADRYAWDGHTLWINKTMHEPTKIRLEFSK